MNKHVKLFFYIILITAISSIGYSMSDTSKKNFYSLETDLILDHNNKPTAALAELLKLLKIDHDNSLNSIVDQTQKKWLRAVGKERWQVQEICAEHSNEILDLAHKLGLIDQIKPQHKHYKYAVIFGATLKRIRTRLAYLVQLWNECIRFEHVICLGSERPLDESVESKESMLNEHNGEMPFKVDWVAPAVLPKTENEVMQLVFAQSQLPADLRNLPITFINSPMIKNNDGSIRRATTGDTIIDWLATKPTQGDCLFISSQPYTSYQDSVMRTYMSNEFGILETCGSQTTGIRNSDILDNLARFLYQERIRRST